MWEGKKGREREVEERWEGKGREKEGEKGEGKGEKVVIGVRERLVE